MHRIKDNIVEGEYIFNFHDIKTKITKNATCKVIANGDKTYDVECYSNEELEANINQAIGKGQSEAIKDKYLMFNLTNDSVNMTINKSPNSFYYKKPGSSGLSGGAIAGIAIICIIAVVIISLLFIMVRKKLVNKNLYNNDSNATLNTLNIQ